MLSIVRKQFVGALGIGAWGCLANFYSNSVIHQICTEGPVCASLCPRRWEKLWMIRWSPLPVLFCGPPRSIPCPVLCPGGWPVHCIPGCPAPCCPVEFVRTLAGNPRVERRGFHHWGNCVPSPWWFPSPLSSPGNTISSPCCSRCPGLTLMLALGASAPAHTVNGPSWNAFILLAPPGVIFFSWNLRRYTGCYCYYQSSARPEFPFLGENSSHLLYLISLL